MGFYLLMYTEGIFQLTCCSGRSSFNGHPLVRGRSSQLLRLLDKVLMCAWLLMRLYRPAGSWTGVVERRSPAKQAIVPGHSDGAVLTPPVAVRPRERVAVGPRGRVAARAREGNELGRRSAAAEEGRRRRGGVVGRPMVPATRPGVVEVRPGQEQRVAAAVLNRRRRHTPVGWVIATTAADKPRSLVETVDTGRVQQTVAGLRRRIQHHLPGRDHVTSGENYLALSWCRSADRLLSSPVNVANKYSSARGSRQVAGVGGASAVPRDSTTASRFRRTHVIDGCE